jgi:hypothetical protein
MGCFTTHPAGGMKLIRVTDHRWDFEWFPISVGLRLLSVTERRKLRNDDYLLSCLPAPPPAAALSGHESLKT